MTGRIHGRISPFSSATTMQSAVLTILLSGLLLLGIGCSQSGMQGEAANTTTAPETLDMSAVEEPGAEPAASPTVDGRGWSDAQATYETLGVRHWQLYLESPFERDGSTNGRWETWGLEDVVATAADPAIFLGQIVAVPVSASLKNPWTCETSRSVFAPAEATYEQPETPSGMTRFDDP